MNETQNDTNQLTPAEAERFSAIMGACPTTWPWWRGVTYHGGGWDDPCDITFAVDNPEGEGVLKKRLSARQVVRALAAAAHSVPSMKHVNPYDPDLDLDADTADCVLQVAVFGEVVYG